MTSDVSDFVEDTEGLEAKEFRFTNKGMRAHFQVSAEWRAKREASAETRQRKSLERADAIRDVKITLPKLKFMEDGE